MKEQQKFIVCVRCFTFNQKAYIEDAMNGFTMQETSFPYVCMISDDLSTDGEQEVIKNYLEQYFDLNDESTVRNEETDDYILTFIRHKTNHNCYFAVYFLKYNHFSHKKTKEHYFEKWSEKAKHVAICEGDDYWTDPTKLQQQVDFLDNNPDYGMVYTNYQLYY